MDKDDNQYDEEEDDKNPYDHNLDVDVGAHVSHDNLKASLTHLPKVHEKPRTRMRVESMVVNKNIISSRLIHLQQRGVILYTVDFNPSRDGFKEWVYTKIEENLKISIEQIKVVTWYTFLVVVNKPMDQK